jgi:hypothetical protein
MEGSQDHSLSGRAQEGKEEQHGRKHAIWESAMLLFAQNVDEAWHAKHPFCGSFHGSTLLRPQNTQKAKHVAILLGK